MDLKIYNGRGPNKGKRIYTFTLDPQLSTSDQIVRDLEKVFISVRNTLPPETKRVVFSCLEKIIQEQNQLISKLEPEPEPVGAEE